MLNLSKVIQEGLKIKRAENKKEGKKKAREKITGETSTSTLKPESSPPPADVLSPARDNGITEHSPAETVLPPSRKVKSTDEAESVLSSITKEIESLDLTTDEEKKVYRIGNLATLNFKDLEEYNPVMIAAKAKEAVKESLLKRYDVDPEELEKKLEDFKKKFRGFGTHCYIHALKEKI